jgi:hypothetical protein
VSFDGQPLLGIPEKKRSISLLDAFLFERQQRTKNFDKR